MSTEQLNSEGLTGRQPDTTPTPAVESATNATDFHVVGIGASAGGLDSLERLFAHLPTDTGMAFVVLQHLCGFSATRLVALSGYGQDSDIQAALEAGFDEHLTKPPDPARIDSLLKG